MWEQRDNIKRNLSIYEGERKPVSKPASHSHWLADTGQK